MLKATNEERIAVLERKLEIAQQQIDQLTQAQRGRWVNEAVIRPFKAKSRNGESYPSLGAGEIPGFLGEPSHGSGSASVTDRATDGMMDFGVWDDTDLIQENEIGVAFKYGSQWFRIPGGPRGLLALTPEGGIPAISGSTLGKAECDIYYLNTSTDGRVDTGLDWDVYNMAPAAVAGDTYIAIMPLYFGAWLAVVEPCDE